MIDFTVESLSGLSQDEKYAAADAFAGVPAGTFRGIHGAESGFGKHLLSPAGAEGDYQIMPNTRANLEKRYGRKFDPYSHDQSLFMSAALIKENLAHFGNPRDAIQAYNSGWDPSKWGTNKESAEYVSRVEAHAGTLYPAGGRKAKARIVTTHSQDNSDWSGGVLDSPANMPDTKEVQVTAASKPAQVGPEPQPQPLEQPPELPANPSLVTAAANSQADAGAQAPKPSLLEMTGAAFSRSATMGVVRWVKQDAFKADPNWVAPDVTDQRFKGMDHDDILHVLGNAHSDAELQHLLGEHTANTDANRAIGSRGGLIGFTVGVAGNADQMLLGMGVGTLLRATGATGVAANVAGETAGNLAIGEATRRLNNERTTAESVLLDAGTAAIPVAAGHAIDAALARRAGTAMEVVPTPLGEEVKSLNAELDAKVATRLPADAAPEVRNQLRNELAEQQVRDVAIAKERRLLSEDVHDPENFAEQAAEAAPAAPADTPAMDLPPIDFSFEVPKELKTVEIDANRYADPAYRGELMKQAMAGRFDEFTTSHFGAKFSDIIEKIGDRTGVITLDGHPASPGATKFMQDNLNLLPSGHRVVLTTKPVKGKDGVTRGGTIATLGDTHFIYVDGSQPLQGVMHASVHEFGHAVYHSWAARIPKDLHERMMKDFAQFRKAVEEGDVDARLMHGAATSENVVQGGALVDRPIPKRGTRNAEGRDIGKWHADPNEFMAEQFVKATIDKHKAVNNKAVDGVFAKAVENFKQLLQNVGALFNKAKIAHAIRPTTSYGEFLEAVRTGKLAQAPVVAERIGTAGAGVRIADVSNMHVDPAVREQRAGIFERVLQCLTSS